MSEVWLPAAEPAYRVPRSDVDALYERGLPAEPKRAGSGQVVSIEGDTLTVLIDEDEVDGVVYLGDPPLVGDGVELELRGDVLVALADDFDYDAYVEGQSATAAHIVSDSTPGLPDPISVPIGSTRSIDTWAFDANAHGWRRDLDVSGTGVHAWQQAGVLKSTNLLLNPSFETGIAQWFSRQTTNNHAIATIAQDANRWLYGTKSLRIDWPAKGTTNGANAVHNKVALDPAKRYVLSLHVYVPEDSPDVRAFVADQPMLSNGLGPLVTEKEQWLWTSIEFTPTDAAGNYVGVMTESPQLGTTCWIDGVVLREATTPLPPDLTYFDGSLPGTAELAFAWTSTAHASSSLWYDGQPGAPGTGVLWSTEDFDVTPGDVLDLSAVLTKVAGADATAQLVAAYSSDGTRDVITTLDPITAYGAAVAIGGDSIALVTQAIVPQALADGTLPSVARIGFQLVCATGTASLRLDSATLTRTQSSWPIGSLWLNPAAGQALPTVGSTSFSGANALMPWQGTASAWGRMPTGNKALVTAPPDCGGLVLAYYSGAFNAQSTINGPTSLDVSVQTVGALASGGSPGRVSFHTALNTGSIQLETPAMGWAQVAAGATVELYPAYRYGADPGTANQLGVRATALTVVFIPTGVAAGDPSQPAPVSYWDGDSWRPGQLPPALMDMSKTATTPEPNKTATTITLARSDGDVHADVDVTLTATVTPAGATGTVVFERRLGSGSWSSIGTASLAAGTTKATKKVTASSSNTYDYRAKYQGDASYLASPYSATVSVRYRTKQSATRTLAAKWVRPYDANGDPINTGNFQNAAQQGDVGGGSSNRRSCIGFDPPSFTGEDVTITRVTLICKDWRQWQAGDHRGTLVAGWHSVKTASAPASYPSDRSHNDRSRHPQGEGSWTANLTSWADSVVLNGDFGGINVGPGGSMAAEFGGWSDNGTAIWKLEVEATYWA